MEKLDAPMNTAQLRQQAEALLQDALITADPVPMTTTETLRLIYELRVHQIELELQNQALLAIRAQLEQSLERYADLYDFAPIGYFVLTANGTIQEANHAGAILLDQEPSDLIDRRFGVFVSTETRPVFNAFLDAALAGSSKVFCEVILSLEGAPPRDLYLECMSRETDTGRQCRLAAINTTERKQAEARIEQMAYHDALTQLPNRVLLTDRLQQAMAQARRDQQRLAVCYLDLDGFKAINDTWGHTCGDGVLIETARRLKACVRTNDTVARLGGDEFVVLLGDLADVDECEQALNRMITALHIPFTVSGQPVSLSTSVGVTLYPDHESDPDALLRYSDQAMYTAKQTGGNRYCWFDTDHERQRKMIKHPATAEQNPF